MDNQELELLIDKVDNDEELEEWEKEIIKQSLREFRELLDFDITESRSEDE